MVAVAVGPPGSSSARHLAEGLAPPEHPQGLPRDALDDGGRVTAGGVRRTAAIAPRALQLVRAAHDPRPCPATTSPRRRPSPSPSSSTSAARPLGPPRTRRGHDGRSGERTRLSPSRVRPAGGSPTLPEGSGCLWQTHRPPPREPGPDGPSLRVRPASLPFESIETTRSVERFLPHLIQALLGAYTFFSGAERLMRCRTRPACSPPCIPCRPGFGAAPANRSSIFRLCS